MCCQWRQSGQGQDPGYGYHRGRGSQGDALKWRRWSIPVDNRDGQEPIQPKKVVTWAQETSNHPTWFYRSHWSCPLNIGSIKLI